MNHVRPAVLFGAALTGWLWPGPAPALAQPPPETEAAAADEDVDPQRRLLDKVARLTAELTHLRLELAEARLEARETKDDLAELRQFVRDHRAYGDDFARYREMKVIAERESRRRVSEANRKTRDAERAARRVRSREIREERTREEAETQRLDRYRHAGFSSLGLDVFVSRMAYSYETRETNPARVDYDPFIGLYYRPGGPTVQLDFGRMTISGSVLNAKAEVRNIGVAITFFDELGNQVGGEIVQIDNARPDVPYPFTASVSMALDRPFSSSSTYVLYADPAASE